MSKLLPAAVIAVLVLLLLVPLVLHFGQKSHNQVTIAPPAGAADASVAPGATFGNATARLMEHELEGFTGWRPNDLLPWGPRVAADNNANRQLGILQALRESVRVFKDHLTKVSSDVYDRNLVEADNMLRNDPYKWAFPSAESRYGEAVERLDAYVAGLSGENPASRPINARNVELIRLIQAWTDLLGDAHSDLFKPEIDWLAVDDVFYRATGYCQVLSHLVPAVEVEYGRELASRPILASLFEEVRLPLARCAVIKPIYVFNGRDTGVLANQRRNLDTYVNEARQKLYSIREELEK